MKRRTFTFGLAALAATPAIPLATSMTPGTAVTQHFPVAKLLARSHNRCTLDMLQRNLRVTPDMARKVHTMLLQRGVITSPVAGVSMAMNPTNTHCVTNEALRSTNLRSAVGEMRERVQRILETRRGTRPSDDKNPPPDDPVTPTETDSPELS